MWNQQPSCIQPPLQLEYCATDPACTGNEALYLRLTRESVWSTHCRFQGLHLDQHNSQQANHSEWEPVNKLLAKAATALADCIAPQQQQTGLRGTRTNGSDEGFQ